MGLGVDPGWRHAARYQAVRGRGSFPGREKVLDPERDPVQRPAVGACRELGVGSGRRAQRVVVEAGEEATEIGIDLVGTR